VTPEDGQKWPKDVEVNKTVLFYVFAVFVMLLHHTRIHQILFGRLNKRGLDERDM